MTDKQIRAFVDESNMIERIHREALQTEVDELKRFISLEKITIPELEKFVSVYQPDASIRSKFDMNVVVGDHQPPFGGPIIIELLNELLLELDYEHPYVVHCQYEYIHPFMDGNGRSGRALWLWCMLNSRSYKRGWKASSVENGFLLNFYFQSLSHYSKGI